MIDADLMIPPHRTPAARAEKLIPAALSLLAAICLVGIASLVVGVWPFTPGDVQWRVQTVGTVLGAVPQFTLLLTVISVAGVFVGQHRVVRAAAAAFFILAALLVVLVPVFALDFLTQRHLQNVSVLGAYTRDGLRIGASAAFLVPFMVWAGVRGWAASRPDTEGDQAQLGHGLIVGQPG